MLDARYLMSRKIKPARMGKPGRFFCVRKSCGISNRWGYKIRGVFCLAICHEELSMGYPSTQIYL